ncbi:transposase [Streptomyces natalensis]|uniref:transposase n=1 Tax=Streptomyces natalensis TaxID=68242 RepID=UPI0012FEC5B5|nr:transposase [Streptomyces natalensis]
MDDDLWALIEPMLPPWPQKASRPKPVDDRLCLQGILCVLYNDVSWQLLPLELGFGSGQTCWRRLGRWHEVSVFEKLHHTLLAEQKRIKCPPSRGSRCRTTFAGERKSPRPELGLLPSRRQPLEAAPDSRWKV